MFACLGYIRIFIRYNFLFQSRKGWRPSDSVWTDMRNVTSLRLYPLNCEWRQSFLNCHRRYEKQMKKSLVEKLDCLVVHTLKIKILQKNTEEFNF